MVTLVGTRRALLGGKRLLKYLLRATFNAPDQGYSNTQVLDTVAEGVQDGTLTVVEADGTLAVVSNKLAFTAQVSPAWGNLGMYSQAITRALGRGLLVAALSNDVTNIGPVAAWKDAQNVNVSTGAGNRQSHALASDEVAVGWQTTTALSLDAVVDATEYTVAMLLGGFDSVGNPYLSGQLKANYTYGTWYFVKGGTFANWTLIWTSDQGNTTPLYAAFSNYSAAGTLDNFRVPDRDLSAIQVPVAYSSFTAANGTSLDAITPEVGGAWTEQAGDWDIQSNRAWCDGTGIATIDSGLSDYIMNLVGQTAGGQAHDYVQALFRYSDSTHYWFLQAAAEGAVDNTFKLYENDAGIVERASAAVTVTKDTDYQIRVILDGQQIDAFLDGGNKISYGLAAMNETATLLGLRANASDEQYDDFVVYPRTSAQYDAVLGGV